MGDFVLQGAILERCEGKDSHPDLRAQLPAPDQLATGSRITPLRSVLCPWQRFDTLL